MPFERFSPVTKTLSLTLGGPFTIILAIMVTATQTKKTKARVTRKKAGRTYDSALKYLFSQTDYEQMLRVRYNRDTFNLNRMKKLLKEIGSPEKKIRSVHIAGTKGKGSTATMLAHMLESCGYKVGLYTSPHITDVRERIQVNRTMIAQADLRKLICKIEPVIEKMGDSKPTFFEIFTAMAFCYFAEQEVDIAVIEAGLGGRLDSTNVLKPKVCGLTSISLDHTHQLGNTVEKIASEKAGIFKSNIPVVSVPQIPEAERVLKRAAKDSKAPLKFTGKDIDFSYRVESSRNEGCTTRICLTTTSSQFEHLPVPVLGEHQAVNCGLALALLDELKNTGMHIDDKLAMEGLSSVYIPGRLEQINSDPRILVDGAHNAASVQALMRALGQHIPYDSLVMVFGCAADKDITGMMEKLATGADKVIFTRAASTPRAAKPQDLAAIYEEISGRQAQVTEKAEDAIQIALNAVSREDIICVSGSFYLVGEIKSLLIQKRR